MQLQYDTYVYIGNNFISQLLQHNALQHHDTCNAMITGYSHPIEHLQYIVICVRNVRHAEHYQTGIGSSLHFYSQWLLFYTASSVTQNNVCNEVQFNSERKYHHP
jgi:hypothetical protein